MKSPSKRNRRQNKTEWKEDLQTPQSMVEQLESTSNSRRRISVNASSCNAHPSIPGLQSHPVSQRKVSVDSDQNLDGSAVRRGSSEADEKDRSDRIFGSESDRGSRSSDGRRVSELRKLDSFFAFLDQFANCSHNSSQRRRETSRRFSTQSFGKEKSSMYGKERKCDARDGFGATTNDDNFLFVLRGSVAGEERSSSSGNQSRSPDEEFWGGNMGGDAMGGGVMRGDDMGGDDSGDDVDDEDFAYFSIYRMCTAFGPGLNEGTVGRLNYFQVSWIPTVQTLGGKKNPCLKQQSGITVRASLKFKSKCLIAQISVILGCSR